MSRQAVHTDSAPLPKGGYSQAVIVSDFVYTAGFGPHHPASGVPVGDSVAEQTARTLDNVEAVLLAAGSGLEHVVKATVHLQNLDSDFAEFDRMFRSRFAEPYPARTTVGSDLAGILVEIDVVAWRIS